VRHSATVSGGGRLLDLAAKAPPPEHVRVGFLEGATYPDGTPVATVAAIQEFGAPRAAIPPRPFFRNMIADKSPGWPEAVSKLLRANGMDVHRTLAMTGLAIAGQLRDSIVALTDPALSQVTLMLRKMLHENPGLKVNRTVVEQARARVAAGESPGGVSTKPLVWTGHLLNSVGSEVEDGAAP
jgi:hypothetical protein